MTIKWNWGTKIFLAYGAFVVFMLFMVYMCTRQHYDLVTPDYYAKELKYQEVINASGNANALAEAVKVVQTAEVVEVVLPKMDVALEEGKVVFYRPDNASLDFTEVVSTEGRLVVGKSRFRSGMYKAKSSWKAGGKTYYNEQSLFIQ